MNGGPESTTPAEDKNRWRTPPLAFKYASARYGPFSLDAAAEPNNHLCRLWLGPGSPLGHENALAVAWQLADDATIGRATRVWCNNPYDETAAFIEHGAGEAVAGRAQTTFLVPATTDVLWWHKFVWKDTGPRPGVVVEFLRRVSFLRPDGSPSKKPKTGHVFITFLADQGVKL